MSTSPPTANDPTPDRTRANDRRSSLVYPPKTWPHPFNTIPRERRAFWLAVLVHGLIIFGITIAFPVKPVRAKPLLIFLGAILESQDLNPQRDQARNTPRLTNQLTQSLIVNSRYRHPAHDVPKPFFVPDVPDNQKIYMKFNFLNSEEPPPPSSEWLQELGINPQPPPRPRLQPGQ